MVGSQLMHHCHNLFAQSMEITSHIYAKSNPKPLHLQFLGNKDEDLWTHNLNVSIAFYTKVEWS